MTNKQQWEKLCKRWQRELQLTNWRFIFKYTDKIIHDAAAEAKPDANALQVIIIAGNTFIKEASLEGLNHVACHELLHARLAPLDDVMNSIFRALPNKTAQVYADWFHAEIEKIVEQLTTSFNKDI